MQILQGYSRFYLLKPEHALRCRVAAWNVIGLGGNSVSAQVCFAFKGLMQEILHHLICTTPRELP